MLISIYLYHIALKKSKGLKVGWLKGLNKGVYNMDKTLRDTLIKQSELEQENRLKNGVIGGLKKGESIIDYLTEEEINKIWQRFDSALGLIDLVDDIIKAREKQTPIKYPYKYILKVAEKQYWPLL